jgi:hypothetical protein
MISGVPAFAAVVGQPLIDRIDFGRAQTGRAMSKELRERSY